VSIDPQGNLRLGPEASPVTIAQLKAELLNRMAKNPDMKLAISADKSAPFGQIIKVMDAAKESNIKMVNAFTKEASK
jgi:biopolymer transport protein ExbD